jgi:hypothetical protein
MDTEINQHNTIINRCNGYTKTGKKCRSKLTEKGTFYCCKNHEPLNMDIFSSGCFMCCENVESTKELIYFKCKHIVHRKCYDEWIGYSNYSNPICMICRKEININIIHNSICDDSKKNKKKVVIKEDYNNNIDYINNILHDDNNKFNYIIYS